MSEFPWIQKTWEWLCDKWRNSFGGIVLAVFMFFFGSAWGVKNVTDDCKFTKAFRDGATVYDCQVRLR